jgi:parallel beta-helix repeat protein
LQNTGFLALVLTLLLGVSDTANAFKVIIQSPDGSVVIFDSITRITTPVFCCPVRITVADSYSLESPLIVSDPNQGAILIQGSAANNTFLSCAEVAGGPILGPGPDGTGAEGVSFGIRVDTVGSDMPTSEGVTVSDCIVIGFAQGIELRNSNNGTFRSNVVVRNRLDGIDLDNSNNNRFFQNTVSGNGEDGIDLNDSAGNEFTQNFVVSNLGNGIDLDNSNFNMFFSNTLCTNGGLNFAMMGSVGNVGPLPNPLCGP